MEKKLYLSLNDAIAAFSQDGTMLRRTYLEGAGALCAGSESIFCADQSGALWRFDKQTLMPQALGCGGPGVCAMCLSACERWLYALLGEADSVLMSDARSGRPLMLNHCGCNPKGLALCGDTLVAAGGEGRCVSLYDPQALQCTGEIAMPGPVYAALLFEDILCALCLTPDLNTLLVAREGSRQIRIPLEGMPGALCVREGCIYASVNGWLYAFSLGDMRLAARRRAPGRADRMIACRDHIILHDPLTENIYASRADGTWQKLCGGVRDVCLA